MQYAQTWDFGLTAQVTYASSHYHVNSNFFSLNPYTTGDLDLQVTQNLLQGFGSAVNGRNIRVQRNNVKVSDLQFKQQVITTVSAALNLYWDLVAFGEDLRARQQEVSTAQQLLDDNKRQVQIGAIGGNRNHARRSAAVLQPAGPGGFPNQPAAAGDHLEECAMPQRNLRRLASRTFTSCRSTRSKFRPTDEIRPVPGPGQRRRSAIAAEIAQAQLNIESNEMNLVGIKNSLKPTLQAFAELTNNGTSRRAYGRWAPCNPGVAYLAGGGRQLLAQIARRNFPNYSAGLSLNIPLRNRAAQSDYATSQLELRQNELNLRKNMNQVDGGRAKRRHRIAAGPGALRFGN